MQPGVCARVFCEEALRHGGPLESVQREVLETGGEDSPDAYRWCPVDPEDQDSAGEWLFQEVFGSLFGMSSAVMNFNRWPRFLQAVARRWLCLLVSIYFDDASLLDLASAKGVGQRHLRAMFRIFGAPLSKEKEVDLGPSADFVGLVHDAGNALTSGHMEFTPCPAIREKATAMLDECFSSGACTPGFASK